MSPAALCKSLWACEYRKRIAKTWGEYQRRDIRCLDSASDSVLLWVLSMCRNLAGSQDDSDKQDDRSERNWAAFSM